MGIYCLHMLVGWLGTSACSRISMLGEIMHINTLMFDAIIFMVCLVLTIFIRCINNKLNWKWVKYTV